MGRLGQQFVSFYIKNIEICWAFCQEGVRVKGRIKKGQIGKKVELNFEKKRQKGKKWKKI
jgi:hypothetical protein